MERKNIENEAVVKVFLEFISNVCIKNVNLLN